MVIEKATELGKALLESTEFTEFLAARDAVDNDETARNLLASYDEKAKICSMNKQLSPEDTAEIESIEKELEALRVEVVNNQKLTRMVEAQNAFQELMNEVNKVIGHFVSPESECDFEGCSGNCAGCGQH